ncbi:unnamed protein product [Nesidiocoris tenuis]|uniref:Uncharacterized protein n=1 Tax=Nesidiocoris tenuis TaxID=355587 RepID=A0A6H5FV64_9HEMI|nr:unnamed protein product [Nesidiocoris tenuis]
MPTTDHLLQPISSTRTTWPTISLLRTREVLNSILRDILATPAHRIRANRLNRRWHRILPIIRIRRSTPNSHWTVRGLTGSASTRICPSTGIRM